MLPFIIGGAVIAVAAGVTAWRKYSAEDSPAAPPARPVVLGRITIWGRPNAGKSTFVNRLVRKYDPSVPKEVTTSKTVYRDVPLSIGSACYTITEIVDMPGTIDRRDDWLESVKTHDHAFYLLNLSRQDKGYLAQVRNDLEGAVGALRASPKQVKRLHIVASHIDKSAFKDVDAAQINNRLQSDDDFRQLYQSMDGVGGYVYAANLTDDASYRQLIESIVQDNHA